MAVSPEAATAPVRAGRRTAQARADGKQSGKSMAGKAKPGKLKSEAAGRRPATARSPAETAPPWPAADRRATSKERRRQAILTAALDVFSERGFASARLDDVAAAAGVAKGTLYLYFPDKEALFQALVRSAAESVATEIAEIPDRRHLSYDEALARIFAVFRRDILGTRRKHVLRLLLAEGGRFPALAEFYWREILTKAMPVLAALAHEAVRRGEIASDAAARFPQLIMSPLIMTVIWDGLFSRFAPLDVDGLIEAHRELLLGRRPGGQP